MNTASLKFAVTETQPGDHLFGAGEFVVMVQLRYPWRRRAMIDDQQQSARSQCCKSVLECSLPVQVNRGMQELRRDQVECAVGEAIGQIELDELDAVGDATRLRSLVGTSQRSIGDVDRDDIPAPLGKPHRVGTLTTPEIECTSRS